MGLCAPAESELRGGRAGFVGGQTTREEMAGVVCVLQARGRGHRACARRAVHDSFRILTFSAFELPRCAAGWFAVCAACPRFKAVVTRPTWENACGKLPR